MKFLNNEDDSYMVMGQTINHMTTKVEECRENNIFHISKHELTKFHSWKVPKITLIDYMMRIHKYVKCSSSCYMVALIYIDRILQRHPKFYLTKYNVHR